MSQQIYDIDTIGYKDDVLGNFYDFYVNNTFYLLAPDYYISFYTNYLKRCLAVYDGWTANHNIASGFVPQRMLQSVANGLNNMLFAHGIDFSGDKEDYDFAVKWAKSTKLYKALKKGHKYAIAGGTSLLKLNRDGNTLFATAHRIDTFFADIDAFGEVQSVKVYFDVIHNTNASGGEKHYGICEERYFNDNGIPCVKCAIYQSSGNLQTETQARPKNPDGNVVNVTWQSLPKEVKRQIKRHYPSILFDKEEYLPFANNLGCFLMRFTDDIPQVPNTQFGQPIGDILFTENFQYDQMKYFEKNEVDLARARAMIPAPLWNNDDPEQDRALDQRFFQKVSSNGTDEDKITPIQFNLRGNDIRTTAETIYKDISFKIGVSASSIASFLNEGAGARTATEIVNERTKTDTWIKGQINLNAPEVNEMLDVVMRYYNKGKVEILFKSEDQSPFLERLKTNSDVLSAGNISPRLFVKNVYSNLTEQEQANEIAYLENTMALKQQAQMQPIVNPTEIPQG